MSKPKLHNAMWPGLVGKGDEEGQFGQEPVFQFMCVFRQIDY